MNDMAKEDVSALMDGELAPGRIDDVVGMLRRTKEQETWYLYHQIGDMLRSDDMAESVTPQFHARMMARLDQEPLFIGPAVTTTRVGPVDLSPLLARPAHACRRYIVPGLAATAAVAYLSLSPMMTATRYFNAGLPVQIASESADTSAVPVLSTRGVVLRDPRIDEYLLAHQRFSPSVYSSAQFARSATFATDSDK